MKFLEGLLILSRQNKSRGSIYEKGKERRLFYDEPGSGERQLMLELLLDYLILYRE